MAKFQPSKNEKIVISIRIEEKTLEIIDDVAAKIDISRNEFINQCIEFAINNIEFKNEDNSKIKNEENIEVEENNS